MNQAFEVDEFQTFGNGVYEDGVCQAFEIDECPECVG